MVLSHRGPISLMNYASLSISVGHTPLLCLCCFSSPDKPEKGHIVFWWFIFCFLEMFIYMYIDFVLQFCGWKWSSNECYKCHFYLEDWLSAFQKSYFVGVRFSWNISQQDWFSLQLILGSRILDRILSGLIKLKGTCYMTTTFYFFGKGGFIVCRFYQNNET